jgi:aryl-alcohol dehydrogenase-like predicted oxidoreductase
VEYVKLAGIVPQVSRIGLGGEQLGGHGWGAVVQDDLVGAVRRALDLGVTFFDTAPIYGLGRSEELLGEELRSRRHDVVIATKCGLRWTTEPEFTKRPDGSAEWIRAELEGSLQRLRTDYVDLYQIHWPDQNTPLADTLGVLQDLRREGKVLGIGCCNFPVDMVRESVSLCPLSTVQVPYNFIDRRAAADVIPFCRTMGVSVLAYSPLARGLLTGRYVSGSVFASGDNRSHHPYVTEKTWQDWPEVVARLTRMASAAGRTPVGLAVGWVLATQGVGVSIVGAKDPRQIEEVCLGTTRALTMSEFHELSAAGRLAEDGDSNHDA